MEDVATPLLRGYSSSNVVIGRISEKRDVDSMAMKNHVVDVDSTIPPKSCEGHRTDLVQKLMDRRREPGRKGQAPTIFRVPGNIRKSDEENAYTPQFVTIGPYHQGKLPCSDVVYSLERYKSWCLRFLLHRNGRSGEEARKILQKCAHKMADLEPLVSCCYSSENPGLDGSALVEAMLLDGCFLLTRLLDGDRRSSPRTNTADEVVCDVDALGVTVGENPIDGMRLNWEAIDCDLLKLENQIPFFVLEQLFQLLKTPEDESIPLVCRALRLFGRIGPARSDEFVCDGKKPQPHAHVKSEYHHLLHLFYSSLVTPNHPERRITRCNHEPNLSHEWIPSATELRMAGVEFRARGRGHSFVDVKFKGGVMEIPTLRLEDHSNSVLRNLIAYEQCYPGIDTMITTYAIFMDCLVDTSEDASFLESSGILLNRLSTDEAAANLFNGITSHVHTTMNYLHDDFVKVNRYHQYPWNRNRALLIRNYFSNPWASISMVVAIILLAITFLNTYYSTMAYFYPD